MLSSEECVWDEAERGASFSGSDMEQDITMGVGVKEVTLRRPISGSLISTISAKSDEIRE
jgi:hypothetical protein